MILITGAAGKTGQAICAALKQRGQAVRALVRRQEQAAEVLGAGVSEVVTGDITSQADLEKALEGAEAVYHISPNMHPEEFGIGQALIAAAQKQGTRRLVYHSVLHPQVETMPHHWKKMRVEELLFTSGLDFTILQPAAYMQNTLGQLGSIQSKGIYSSPYRVSTRLSMVDLADVAEAAALVLSGTQHTYAIYELAGREALSQVEVAEAFAKALGKPVRAVEQPRDEWENGARKGGMPEYAVSTLLKMFEYYDRYGLIGNPNALAGLLGRQPGDFSSFLERSL